MPDESIQVNAGELREIVRKILAETIELHRSSRTVTDGNSGYKPPVGEPTDEEIDDFLFSNPLLDSESVQQLTDWGIAGIFCANCEDKPSMA